MPSGTVPNTYVVLRTHEKYVYIAIRPSITIGGAEWCMESRLYKRHYFIWNITAYT